MCLACTMCGAHFDMSLYIGVYIMRYDHLSTFMLSTKKVHQFKGYKNRYTHSLNMGYLFKKNVKPNIL